MKLTVLRCVGLAILPALLNHASICPAQESVKLRKESVQLRGGGSIDADLGRIEVPENRNKKESRKISLAFLRVPSPLKEPGPPVFMLAGGPGGSSIEMVKRHMAGSGGPILEMLRGDLIGIDQRGVGQSRPNLDSTTLYGFPLEEPGNPVKMLKIIQSRCKTEAKRWQKSGVDLTGYTTVESADDIDTVRRALGYDKIVLWGESYGSHLALATIRHHEKFIDRAVLICPEGPDHTLKLPSDTQGALERLAALVKADAAWGKRIPDLLSLIKTVLDRLDKAPVVVEVDGVRVGISKFDVQGLIADKLSRSRRGIDQIPATIQSMADGDFLAVAGEIMEFRRADGIQSAMAMVMDSASGVSKTRAARIAKESKDCLLGDASNFPYPSVATAWGAPDLGEEFRRPLKSEVPVLMIVGDLDARTTIGNARELMTHLPKSNLVVVSNVSHDVPWGVGEIRKHWHDFLSGQDVGEKKVTGPTISFAK
ncbi:MAG: alpha/beta hydrolase [Planctomycetota bacterium]